MNKPFYTFTLVILMTLFTKTSLAEVSVSGSLNFSMTTTSHGKKSKKVGTMNCNPGGQWLTKDIESYVKDGPHTFNSNRPFSFDSSNKLNITVGGSIGESLAYPRNITFETSISENKTTFESKINLHISEVLNLKQFYNHSDQCDTTEWVSISENDSSSGSIAISYQVPKNTWLLEVTRGNIDGDFIDLSHNPKPLTGDLVPEISSVRPNQKTIIWVIPGSTVQENITITRSNKGAGLSGSYTIQFKPVGIHKPDISLLDISKNIEQFRVMNNNELIEVSHYFLTKENETRINFDLLNYRDKLRLLERLRDFSFSVNEDPTFWHVKAGMSLLLLNLSHYFLTQHIPLCEFSKENPNTTKLTLVQKNWGELLKIISSVNFVLYSDLLQSIDNLGKSGITGQQLMLGHADLQKIQKAYYLAKPLQRTFQKSLTISEKLHPALEKTFLEKDSLELINILKLASNQETAFIESYRQQLTNLKNSSSPLNVEEMIGLLPSLQNYKKSTESILTKYSDLIYSGNFESQSKLIELYASTYGLFTEPLDGVFFERIRSAYLKHFQLTKLSINQCVFQN